MWRHTLRETHKCRYPDAKFWVGVFIYVPFLSVQAAVSGKAGHLHRLVLDFVAHIRNKYFIKAIDLLILDFLIKQLFFLVSHI